MVKKGQEQVSRMDSPRQGEDRNPDEGKVKHRPKPRGGDGDRNSAQSEGSSKGS